MARRGEGSGSSWLHPRTAAGLPKLSERSSRPVTNSRGTAFTILLYLGHQLARMMPQSLHLIQGDL
jgi:hypothetical protein